MDPKDDRPVAQVEPLLELDRALDLVAGDRWVMPQSTDEDAEEPLPADGIFAQPSHVDELDDAFETLDDPRIPEAQSYFKIGEVARIVGVKPYVLRYWEGEFPWVRPEKTSSRQRRYRRQDVAMLLTIRRLRHDEQLTVARTRELIQEMKRSGKKRPAKPKRPVVRAFPPDEPMEAAKTADPALLRRRLAEMRQAVVELLSAVEE